MDNLEICSMSAVQMVDAVKNKRLSPREIIDAVLHRIERLNPRVNAYCTIVADSARRQAKEAEDAVMRGDRLGLLHGVPVSVKDLIFTKGVRTTAGSKILENFIPQQDAIAVERLKAAGAIVIGKTNTPEFGWKAVADNLLFGVTRNPWNLERTSGGSSGGAAAAVALCLGPLAIGTDGGGSIRIPSSFCGVFGFKPSFGRVPQYPKFPGLGTLSHTGPISQVVEDAALVMEVIAGGDERDRFCLPDAGLRYSQLLDRDLKGLRVAWSEDLGYAAVDRQVLKVTEAAAKTFATLGCAVEEAHPEIRSPESAFSTIAAARIAAALQDKVEEWKDQIEPLLVRFVERGRTISATEYVRACLKQEELWEEMFPFFEKYNLLLTPTVAVPPFEIGIIGPREIAGRKVAPNGWIAFTYPFNMTGQPAASVPCGWTEDGLPIGLQIVGRRFDDITVLRAAAAFEQASPWVGGQPLVD